MTIIRKKPAFYNVFNWKEVLCAVVVIALATKILMK